MQGLQPGEASHLAEWEGTGRALLHYALGLCIFASVFFLQLTAGPGQAGSGQGSDPLSVG